MVLRCLSTFLLVTACAGPKVELRRVEVPREVVSWGVATAQDPKLARRIAESRAVEGLARLLEPGAVAFGLRAAGGEAVLELQVASREVPVSSTAFEQVKGSTVARASAKRSEAATKAMAELLAFQAQSQVQHPDPAISLLRAETRALRQAILKVAGVTREPVLLRGKLTLIKLDEKLTESGAVVSLAAHITLAERRHLSEAEQRSVLEDALREYRSLQEWDRAVEAVSLLIKLAPSAAIWTELGQIQELAGRSEEAADAYRQAGRLEPTNTEHLKREMAAAKRIPDPDRVIELQRKLRALPKR